MKLWHAIAWAALLGLACAPQARAGDINWQDDAAVRQLVRKLADADFTAREEAQKQLNTSPFETLDKIRQFADQTDDAEAKSRLSSRADTMETDHALNPKPISLNVDNGTLADVSAGLTQALGVQVLTTTNAVNETYTLSAKDKPFWEVIKELSDQHPLWVSTATSTVSSLRLQKDSTTPAAVQTTGGLCIRLDVPRAAAGANQVTATLGVAFDPRINITAMQYPNVKSIVDQDGNDIPPGGQVNGAIPVTYLRAHVYARSFAFATGDAPVTSVTMRGEVTMTLLIPDVTTKTVVERAAEKRNETTKVGDMAITLKQLAIGKDADGTRTLTVETQILPDTTPAAAGARGRGVATVSTLVATPTVPVSIRIIDAKGRVVFSNTQKYTGPSAAEVSTTIPVTEIAEPLKMEIIAATKTREVTVPFEFKNVAVDNPAANPVANPPLRVINGARGAILP